MNKPAYAIIINAVLALNAFAAPVRIAASLPDLASIASFIGGDKVEVFSIAKGNANPHFVEVLPSYMIKVSRCDIYLKNGLALDQWADDIIDGSRNSKLAVVDCSNGISVLHKLDKADASMGDVHPQGNPHYWLNPMNGVVVAGTIRDALKKADPDNSAFYEGNYIRFKEAGEKHLAEWKARMEKLSGQKIITYHSSWAYFADTFGLLIAGTVEPFPGIPPTGKHLAGLVDMIKKSNISILLQESYFPDSAPRFLSRQTGVRVFKFSPSAAGTDAGAYFKHFEEIVGQLAG